MEAVSGAPSGRKARWRRPREPRPSCDFCAARGDGHEFTVFGCRDFTICYGRDAAGTTLIWSPDLGIPGEITDVRQQAGDVQVTVAPAAGSAHPSEVVTGRIPPPGRLVGMPEVHPAGRQAGLGRAGPAVQWRDIRR